MPEQEQKPSKLLDKRIGNYRVKKVLGKGSMGEVYLAVHPVMGHEVAIKILAEDFSSYPELVSRFRREARAVAAVKHSAIVRAFDFGDLDDGRSYYVMELLKGKSLQAYMTARGPLPTEECSAIILPLMEALGVCHTAGFIHRDIKPENVFLTTDEEGSLHPKIIDFGIAKLKHPDGEGDSVVTRMDAVLGTPLYMAPEQGPGLKSDVGPWSDVYSLAATLFQMFAGKPPFYSDSPMELMIMQTHRERPSLSEIREDVPEALSEVIRKAMAIQPTDRFQSMEEFATAYKNALDLDTGQFPAMAPGPLSELSKLDGLEGQALEEALGGKTLVDHGPLEEASVETNQPPVGRDLSAGELEAINKSLASAASADPAARDRASAAGDVSISERSKGAESPHALEGDAASEQGEKAAPASPVGAKQEESGEGNSHGSNEQRGASEADDSSDVGASSESGSPARTGTESWWRSAKELVMDAGVSPEVELAAARRKKKITLFAVGAVVLVAAAIGAYAAFFRSSPPPASPAHFLEVTSSSSHTCAIQKGDGSLWCWGRNDYGQLGIGNTKNQKRPQRVERPKEVVSVSAGGRHTCAVSSDGSVWCWGKNKTGQLGDGTVTPKKRPTRVKGLERVKSVHAGAEHTCALIEDGSVSCWGWNAFGQAGDGSDSRMHKEPATVKGLSAATTLTAGGFHNCAILKSGSIVCWGRNDEGQLGAGHREDKSTPVAVDMEELGGERFALLSAGGAHTCGIDTGGRGYCWGRNASGQLGDGTTESRSRPVGVEGSSTYVDISAGGGYLGGFTCAVEKKGAVSCWGNNLYGQLGTGDDSNQSPKPLRLKGLGETTKIEAGGLHACAVDEPGVTHCWGRNNDGQLGLGVSDDRERPGLVKK
jgi:serine/threonine protein kinase/alpha-tubulin suppressor-like RCC1 family protein